jgi:hypothetical protein
MYDFSNIVVDKLAFRFNMMPMMIQFSSLGIYLRAGLTVQGPIIKPM